MRQVFTSTTIFDGQAFRTGALIVEDGVVVGIGDAAGATDLGPGTIAPGFVDLQVNGGDGVMLDADPATLHRMATAHARLGTTSLFPTLITDTPAMTRAVTEMVAGASIPGIAGLHLEGPHLSTARKGAHDPALIRPMTDDDLQFLTHAATRLRLMVTIAPENASLRQVRALTAAGIIVSLGHTDCTYATACAYIAAGARVATHLFNAMSQIGNREPGIVGAILTQGSAAGIIADGHHVHPANLALAAQADIFLVTDAMACAGTRMTQFNLQNRTIHRRDGRLTLQDGTLAGADLDMATAIRTMRGAGIADARALAMATSVPARVGRLGAGRLAPGTPADFVHLSPDLTLQGTWRSAQPVA
jgi:N-acetylglucosamine-6-phosphate deacetylase